MIHFSHSLVPESYDVNWMTCLKEMIAKCDSLAEGPPSNLLTNVADRQSRSQLDNNYNAYPYNQLFKFNQSTIITIIKLVAISLFYFHLLYSGVHDSMEEVMLIYRACFKTIGCTDCEDYKGRLSCDYGERIWWSKCTIHYCDGAGAQLIGDTTSEPEATEPDVTDTDTDTDTNEATHSRDVETTPLGTKCKPTDIETEYAIAMFSSNDIFGSVAARGQFMF